MRYRYITKNINQKLTASIKEVASDLILVVDLDIDEARKITKHLNLGGGFDGNTPEFFCHRMNQSGF